MENYCVQCSLANGYPLMKPDLSFVGKLHMFKCAGCGWILVDYTFECWDDDCREKHMEMRLDGDNGK